MKSYLENIINYSDGVLSKDEREQFESEILLDMELKEEFKLFSMVNKTMKAKYDMDESVEDEILHNISMDTSQLISEYINQPSKYNEVKEFVVTSMTDEEDSELQKEIDPMIQEINTSGVDSVTQAWVNSWNNSNTKSVSSKQQGIRNYVESALNSKTIPANARTQKPWYQLSITRFATLSAAAILALVLVIRSVLQPVSPEKLFELNYKPYQALTAVTRSDANDLNSIYNQAIVDYRSGNFQQASIGFDLVIKSDTFSLAPKFFAGITQIETGNYEKAMQLLRKVAESNAEYTVEAKWYLGLTYLKLDKKDKAILCFNDLSTIPGYYQNQAKSMLDELQD